MTSPKDLTSTFFNLSDFMPTQPLGQDLNVQKSEGGNNTSTPSEQEKNIHWLLRWAF
jgi:hypothetical protein